MSLHTEYTSKQRTKSYQYHYSRQASRPQKRRSLLKASRKMRSTKNGSDCAPAQYPQNYSYRNIVNSLLENENHIKGLSKYAPNAASKSSSQSNTTTSTSSSLMAEVSPSFTLNPGDVKMIHHLRSGGKLVVQKKKNGDVAYALSCPDGRKLFLEKTKELAVLSLTDSQGHSIKTLACEF